MNSQAWRSEIAPLAIGRPRVRATRESKSRSTMSFKVQPAPRMAMAPMPNSAISRQSGIPVRATRFPTSWEQQQPGADRPIESREAQIGPPARRSIAVDPIAARMSVMPHLARPRAAAEVWQYRRMGYEPVIRLYVDASLARVARSASIVRRRIT